MIAYIATESTITIILDSVLKTIQVKNKLHRNEVIKVLEKYKKSHQGNKEKEELLKFLTPIKRIGLASDNRFEINEESNELFLVGTTKVIPSTLSDKILDFLDSNLSVEPLVKFWESCLRNPHYKAVEELFLFLEANKLPITEDGAFLGYKKLNFAANVSLPKKFEKLFVDDAGYVKTIKGDRVSEELKTEYLEFINDINNPIMKDVYSGTIKQKLGSIVKIDRVRFNEEERRKACGYGLHIGSFGYSFSGNVRVLCKVFPENVIACNPNEAKLRTCEYKIVSFVDEKVEVQELLVDMSTTSKDEEFKHSFKEGDLVLCNTSIDNITKDLYYYILSIDEDTIIIINDLGEEEEYECEYFSK